MAVHVVVVSEAFFTIPLLTFGNFSSAALLWWRTFRSSIGCMMGMASDPFLNDRFFLDGLRCCVRNQEGQCVRNPLAGAQNVQEQSNLYCTR